MLSTNGAAHEYAGVVDQQPDRPNLVVDAPGQAHHLFTVRDVSFHGRGLYASLGQRLQGDRELLVVDVDQDHCHPLCAGALGYR